MPSLTLCGITKRFGPTCVLRPVDLAVAEGELLVVLGPSGSGKSTLLRVIAGLETPSEGRVRFDDRDVTDLPPHARDVAMVFQDAALYPHMTVRANIAFGLQTRRVSREEIASRLAHTTAALDLTPILDRYPGELSGGERRRAALARALARNAGLILLDEPLAHLDPDLRVRIREEILAARRALGATTIHVTHDHAEAMALGHRIAVLHGGRLLQVATPGELYGAPRHVLVARAVGNPPMNLFAATARTAPGLVKLRAGAQEFALCGQSSSAPSGATDVFVGLRPEALFPATSEARLRGRILRVERLGKETLLSVDAGFAHPLRVLAPAEATAEEGAAIALGFRDADVHLFDASGGESLRNPEGADRRQH